MQKSKYRDDCRREHSEKKFGWKRITTMGGEAFWNMSIGHSAKFQSFLKLNLKFQNLKDNFY